MAGQVSYDIAHLKYMDIEDRQFINRYSNFIIGKLTKSYDIERFYATLTGINISSDYYNQEEVLSDINHIIFGIISNKDAVIIGRNRLLSLLENPDIKHKLSIVNQYKLLLRILQARSLPDDILESMLVYIRSMVSNSFISKETINNTFISMKTKLMNTLKDMKSLLYDQILHFESNESDCYMWHIDCIHNNYELGSIFVFYNPNNPIILNEKVGLMIQDIVKYSIPLLVQSLFPDYGVFIPKLNTILETPINMIASSINVNYIFVRPIGNQGDILKKFYGYLETGVELNYPCETISIGFESWLYKEVDKSTTL